MRTGVHILLVLLAFVATSAAVAGSPVDAVSVERDLFEPKKGEKATWNVTLRETTNVTATVYDFKGRPVRALLDGARRAKGPLDISWDGRDDRGHLVPDDAYRLVVQTPRGDWDPCEKSGGKSVDVRNARFLTDHSLRYTLPVAARVLVRIGVRAGPMHRTLIDWEARPAGTHTEPWNGLDESGVVRVHGKERFGAVITYVTFPDATVVTRGSGSIPHAGAVSKGEKIRACGSGATRPRPRAPRVLIERPDGGDDPGAIPLRIDVPDADRAQLLSDQFEVMFYVDGQFHAEAERGYVPLNWEWDVSQLAPGEHVLTVNISSLGGQVGAASYEVRVDR